MPYRVPSSFKSSSHYHFYQGAVRCRDLSDGLSPAALQSTELALALSPSEPLPTSRYSHFLFPPRCLFGPVRISQSFPALSCATAQSAFGSTAGRLNASRWALQGRPWQRPFHLATRWFSSIKCKACRYIHLGGGLHPTALYWKDALCKKPIYDGTSILDLTKIGWTSIIKNWWNP